MSHVNVVLGAGGPTGKECVQRLLTATDPSCVVKAVVRSTTKHQGTFPQDDRLELVQGDVEDVVSLKAALKGAKGIIFAASGAGYWSAAAVDNQGVKNVVDVAKELGCVERVVLVSSMLTHPSNRFHPIRILLNNIRYSLMDHKFKGEEYLRNSGLPYTVVRPGGLGKGPGGKARITSKLNTTKESTGGGTIERADVAAVCVEALTYPAAAGVTVSIQSPSGEARQLQGSYEQEVKQVFAPRS